MNWSFGVYDAASASKKATEKKIPSGTNVKQSKQLEKEHKHTVLPKRPATEPGVN
jgi:hypothetical protein